MRKIFKLAYLVAFLIMLTVPAVLTNTEENAVSEFDNRALAAYPVSGEPEYEEKIEIYLKDRIGLREWMVTEYQLLNNCITHELKHPSYTYGQNSYVFFNMHNNIDYGSYHKTFAEATLKMQQYCESRGAKFYFLFDPEKISVYRRYLPIGVNYNDQWVEKLQEYMQTLGIDFVNNSELLTELSYEEQVFNRQYDAGHWNDLGAFYGTNNLWKAIHRDFSSVTEYSKDEFEISAGNAKYLPASRFPVKDVFPVFIPKFEWTDISDCFAGLKHDKRYPFFRYYINKSEDSNTYPRILVFHGSYYNRCPEMFIGRAKEYIGVHDYQNVLNLDYYFNVFQPDIVVFEVAEYTFAEKYFDSKKMGSLDYNPGLLTDGQSVEDVILKIQETAEEYITESYLKLNISKGTHFDTVFFERLFPTAQYVYLLTTGGIFDLQEDINGTYTADIPSNAINDDAILYYIDNEGKDYWTTLKTRDRFQYVKMTQNYICTGGAEYDEDQLTLETKLKDNHFNMINLQLINEETGEFIENIISKAVVGKYIESYSHTGESGKYLLRLKANANLKDEGMDIHIYLIKGEHYSCSLNIIELTTNKVVIENYEFLGPPPPDEYIVRSDL